MKPQRIIPLLANGEQANSGCSVRVPRPSLVEILTGDVYAGIGHTTHRFEHTLHVLTLGTSPRPVQHALTRLDFRNDDIDEGLAGNVGWVVLHRATKGFRAVRETNCEQVGVRPLFRTLIWMNNEFSVVRKPFNLKYQ